ncbi:MAG: enoyl-CoA hydratase-related protein [Actinomycetota bacterium]|nr:enoyl-CoA hydratase-related protein [Actinomycetota bacterium]
MTSEGVVVTAAGSVGTITLTRPAKRNAVTYDMWVALGQACQALAADPAARVVVLRGAGDHFCAGADIGELLAERPAHSPTFMDVNMVAEHALATLSKPTVAFVQGDCIGGGCALAIDCDIRLAVEGSRFGITPAKLGIVYPPASLERVVRLLGPAARRLLYTGDLIDADEALHLGLIDELLPAHRAEARLAELCATLSERSLLTQAATKEMIAAVLRHGAVPADLADAWAREVAVAADPAEGVAAFAERRSPRFTWSGPNPTA